MESVKSSAWLTGKWQEQGAEKWKKVVEEEPDEFEFKEKYEPTEEGGHGIQKDGNSVGTDVSSVRKINHFYVAAILGSIELCVLVEGKTRHQNDKSNPKSIYE